MEFVRKEYQSLADNSRDWYLCHDRGEGSDGLIYLHGHGSGGDQLVTRVDVAANLPFLADCQVSILAPNLRGNAWMNPLAARDLAWLIETMKQQNGWKNIFIIAGSMGGTGALIFAMLYPELVQKLAILGAATSIGRYLDWCAGEELPILKEIHDAIRRGYPDDASLTRHDVSLHADRLTMPIWLFHAADDRIISVEEARDLAEKGGTNIHYTEIAEGGHDAPLAYFQFAVKELLKK